MNEDDVRKAVLSFPAGSALGPDSLCPQHLRDMVLRKEAGPQLISALTGFINLVLAAAVPRASPRYSLEVVFWHLARNRAAFVR